MKDAIRLNLPTFNTARMVAEYAERAYFPASDRARAMISNDYAPAKDLARWHHHLFEHWYDMKIDRVDVSSDGNVQVEQEILVTARIRLGELTPDDVQVELYQGAINEYGEIANGQPVVMEYVGADADNPAMSIYQRAIAYRNSGFQGLSLRILPKHENLSSPYQPGLVLWA
jgi:starch phosphorylase